ncbi:MAG: PQQ-binding-like beta-propeller repeat protein [Planctomycetes bacterium]|nr:PQQ-binding-like beta-propeller repeat protein [Planctomycetota bacterium]
MTTPPSLAGTAIADLVFVGFNSRAAALHRETGRIVWKWRCPRGYGPVALMLDGDRLIASVQGYTYCLDAATGERLWQNDMKGFGIGVPCLTSHRSSSMASAMLAQHQQQQTVNNTAATT